MPSLVKIDRASSTLVALLQAAPVAVMATPVVEDPRLSESISARSKTLTPSLKLASALQVSPAISTGPTRAVTSPRTRHVPKMVRAFVVREHERQARGLQRLVVPTLTETCLGEKPIRLRQHVIASRAGQVDRLTEQPLRLLVFAEAEAGAGEVAQAQDLLRRWPVSRAMLSASW